MSECFEQVNNAEGSPLSREELAALEQSIDARTRYLMLRDGLTEPDARLQAGREIAEEIEAAALADKRNAVLNATKRLERVFWVKENFGSNLALGVESMLVGTQRAAKGSRVSVASIQATLEAQYLRGFTYDIEKSGHGDLFASGAMDRDVSRALYLLRTENPDLKGIAPEAVDLAKIIAKWQDVSRADANRAGASIHARSDYIVMQTHDPERIRRSGYAEWAKMAKETFDLPRMLVGATNVEEVLHGLWVDFTTGKHLKAGADDVADSFKGPANLAKKLSQRRVVLFKNADTWFDYNERFGADNLREAVVGGLQRRAQATGLMQMLGANPEAMLNTIRDDLTLVAKAAGDVEQATQLARAKAKHDRYLSVVDGSMDIPGNAMWARRAANVRAWGAMSKLGGMLLSQLADVAAYAAGTSYQGRGFFTGMAESVAGLGRSLEPMERRELAASLGVALDNMAGELGRIGSFSELAGQNFASKAVLAVTNNTPVLKDFLGHNTTVMGVFMKMNGAQWWTTRMRTSAAFGMSHDMAQQAGKAFTELSDEYKRLLGLYDISEGEWNLIRQSAAKHVDGKAYITPEGLRDVSDEVVRAHIGQSAGEREIADTKRDLEGKLRNYFVDQTSFLALEPDAKTRAILLQGTQAGTRMGELMRFMMQFKSFTGAFMQKILGREIYGRGYEGDSIFGALRHGNGEFQGLARVIATATLMGYASMALKDLAKGKTPRDPTESPAMAAKVFAAAIVQGGGAGIYGDFLFGAANRMGSGTIESLAGPVLSTGGRIIDLYHKAVEGDKVAARAFGEVLNNTPFANLFYVRPVLNHMILYQIQEWLSPGYLRRMERDAEQRNGQDWLIRPTAALR